MWGRRGWAVRAKVQRGGLAGFFSTRFSFVPKKYPAEHYITWFFSRQVFFVSKKTLLQHFSGLCSFVDVVAKGSGKGFSINISLLYVFPNFSEGTVLGPASYFSEGAVLGPAC
jgi:hypothetical protein